MKLYYNPLSTYSQKALLGFYEKDVAFEPEIVALLDPVQKAAYREVYPIGKIPLLVLDDGHMIPESTIILEYLEGHYPAGTRLIPENPDDARQTRFMDRMADLYLNNPLVAMLFEGMKPEAEQNPEVFSNSAHYVDCSYGHLNKRLADNQWLCGDGFSMADCATLPALFYAQNIRSFEQHENIVRYWTDAGQRPAHQKLMADVLPALEAWQASHQGA